MNIKTVDLTNAVPFSLISTNRVLEVFRADRYSVCTG